MIFALAVLCGCFHHTSSFNPIKKEIPISLFDRYHISIRGYDAIGRTFLGNVSFIKEIVDTTSLDSLPILVFDSICFHGDCLGEDFCVSPKSWYDDAQDNLRKGWGSWNLKHLIKDTDLYYKSGKVTPGGFDLRNVFRLPENCDKMNVSVGIHARILDRKTKVEFASENKIIRFEIKRGRRLEME